MELYHGRLVGSSRLNYSKVKDEAAFMAWLSELGEVSVLLEDNDYIAITGDNFDGWPHAGARIASHSTSPENFPASWRMTRSPF